MTDRSIRYSSSHAFPATMRSSPRCGFRTMTALPTTTTTTTTMLMALLFLVATTITAASATNAEYDDGSSAPLNRRKPWFFAECPLVDIPQGVRSILVGLVASVLGLGSDEYDSDSSSAAEFWVPTTLCLSPCTILLILLVLANFHSWISYHLSGSWVEASHILVKDTSPKTLKALVGLAETLGKDAKTFGLTAQQYSQCPSAAQRGALGRFGKGTMAPPFDAVCFDPETPLNTTIGPIQTQFGYHLIYIKDRKL